MTSQERDPDVAAAVGRLMAGKPTGLAPDLVVRAANALLDELPQTPASAATASWRKAMGGLIKARHFAASRLLGLAWRDRHGPDAVVDKHLAQALIELGALDAAEEVVDSAQQLVSRPDLPEFVAQAGEYQGLRGRICKQRFVAGEDLAWLCRATDAYREQFETSKRFHHGINVLALVLREAREGLPVRTGIDPELMARAVEAAALKALADDDSPWPLAAASEASLALDRLAADSAHADRAELWLHRLLAHPGADPFVIESYHRQIREIWRGDGLRRQSTADRLAAIIESHVMRTQQRWNIDASRVNLVAADESLLEKNFSGERAFTLRDLQTMVGLCPGIGCVTDASGVRMGTGFLMAGGVFGFEVDHVFVTNAHVIGTDVNDALAPEQARVSFETECAQAGVPVFHAVDRLLYSSAPGRVGEVRDRGDRLDVSIVTLRTLPGQVKGLPAAVTLPRPRPGTRAFVVGHPRAGPLQFSLSDSELLDICREKRLLHYRTPTEPGSSGSPVFNDRWEVIALHHAGSQSAPRLDGSGQYEANEGIALEAIRAALGRA